MSSRSSEKTSQRISSHQAWRVILILLTLSAGPLLALDRRVSITQYLHTSWTQEEGIALPAINGLAQTADGYLWLGTGGGLIRFDGMRFVRWEPPSGETLPENFVRSLLSSRDGSLWIRTVASISRYRSGHIVRYPEADRWLNGRNRAIWEDRSGRLWLVRAGGSPELGVLLPDGTFHVYGSTDGLPGGLWNVFEDKNSNLWITAGHSLCQWTPGTTARCVAARWGENVSIAGDGAVDSLIQDPTGRSLIGVSSDRPAAPGIPDSFVPRCVTSDHAGNIWTGTAGQGLARMAGGKLERFTRLDGLSSDDVRALLEDREHNLWVATARGLDRFRDPQVLRISTTQGLSGDLVSVVHAARDGAVWVGALGRGLDRVVGNRAARDLMSATLPSAAILSLFQDSSERLWVGTTVAFGYFTNRRFIEVRTSGNSSLNGVFAIADDPSGAIWLAASQKGLFTVHDGVAHPVSVPGPQMKDVYQIRFVRDGALWIGHFNGGITVLNRGAVQNFTVDGGLARGPVQAISQDRTGAVWVGARDGLSRFRNGLWTTWDTRHGVPERGVWGIIEDDYGALWFMTSQGLTRLSLATLNQSPDESPKNLEFTLYGQTDEVRVSATPGMANPRSTRSSDGRLWFSTDDGVAVVDPSQIRTNPLPPPVVVEELLVDGKPLPIGPARDASFRGGQVHITYTGLSLTLPERVRFQYRLDGLDRNWNDAGSRRNVDYVNLPPRRYRFRVRACNNDGVWNMEGAALPFQVEPYFYQTTWFLASSVIAVALVIWGFYRNRVRMVVTRLEAIAQERARLTRELHDTLLQGFVAVVYQLEAVLRQFDSAPEAGKQRLERAIEQADQAMGEARRSMMAMRIPVLESSTLPEALSDIARGLTEGTHIHFHLDVTGKVRQLPYDAQANVFMIGREAITNSVNHAHPNRIQAGLAYSAKQVRLTVQDDGEGFDLEAGMAKPNHWGVAGMRERASQIGATLSVSSSPGQGTKVEVVVPCKV